jgi:Vitamin B12 dependent methionine synthase, activation domain
VSLPDGPQVLVDLPLAIDPAEVLRFQGYKRGRDVPTPDVQALFDEALAEGRRLMVPRAVARWAPVTERRPDGLVVEAEALAIPRIGERWGPVERVAVVVCTIGEALEARVAALWDARELALASMLDSVGSGAVESLAEFVNDLLCQQGLPALRVTNRISPGYADWDVVEQRRLFRLCDAGAIGVRLNEACVMTPGKSISLMVGAGPEARVDHYFSQCARCWMRDCAYRRTPMRGTVRRG